MTMRKLLLLGVATVGCVGANRASAQCGAGCGYGYGYWDIGRLYSVLADNVPYYAAFPPVYYSVPVPRTYGYSPFAYPPGVMTPEVEVVEPLAINNPFFSGAVEASPASTSAPAPVDQTTQSQPAAQPLVVANPFVRGGAPTAIAQATR